MTSSSSAAPHVSGRSNSPPDGATRSPSRCACLGCLTPGPTRVVQHGPTACTSTPLDGGERTRIYDSRCPRCTTVRALAVELCRGCSYEARP